MSIPWPIPPWPRPIAPLWHSSHVIKTAVVACTSVASVPLGLVTLVLLGTWWATRPTEAKTPSTNIKSEVIKTTASVSAWVVAGAFLGGPVGMVAGLAVEPLRAVLAK